MTFCARSKDYLITSLSSPCPKSPFENLAFQHQIIKCFLIYILVLQQSYFYIVYRSFIVYFRSLPSWKQKIAGKSLPLEKFAVKKSERFLSQGNMLILPAIELMYVWNGFIVIGKNKPVVESYYRLIEKTIAQHQNTDRKYRK